MDTLFRKFCHFVLVSGVGWLIDFGVFSLLTRLCGLSVLAANYISTLPAVTFVFLVSTRKTFVYRADGLSMRQKYVLYVVYQFILVSLVSVFGQWLYGQIAALLPFLSEANAKLAAKVLITPVTMLCNFFVLRQIAEKW